jgi:hypothetical protein
MYLLIAQPYENLYGFQNTQTLLLLHKLSNIVKKHIVPLAYQVRKHSPLHFLQMNLVQIHCF